MFAEAADPPSARPYLDEPGGHPKSRVLNNTTELLENVFGLTCMFWHHDGMQEDDDLDERQSADSGDDEPTGTPDEGGHPKRTRFRLANGFSIVKVRPAGTQNQLAASVVHSVVPQVEAVLAQQRVMEDFTRHVTGFEQLQNRMLAIQPVLDAARVHQQLGESISRVLVPQLEAYREFARSAILLVKLPNLNLPTDWLPQNWEDVPDLDIGTAMAIILDEGIPLAWVPRPAVIAELVSAVDADARDSVLLSSRGEIVGDCLTVLSEVAAPELKPLAELAVEAVTALRDGHGSSAQALAGNIFDTLLRDTARRGVMFAGPPFGYFKYDKVRKQITLVSDGTSIRRFRRDCVLSAAWAALENYDPSDPPPARFVRHATAHRACPAQYTPVNAIVAVMLVASMLREAEASGW